MDLKKYKGRPSLRLDGVDYADANVYFVTFNPKDRAPHFKDARVAAALLAIIIRARLERMFCVYSYAIMPDRVHLMVQPVARVTLPDIVRAIKGPMTVAFRRLRPGVTLWQRGYVEKIITTRAEFEAVIEYILVNPVRAGLAPDPFSYPFSGVLDYYEY